MSGSYDGIPFCDDPVQDLQAASQRLQSARARHLQAVAALHAAEREVEFHIGRLLGQAIRQREDVPGMVTTSLEELGDATD